VLAALLPLLIDQLTPSGRAPQQGQLLQLGMQLLRGMSAGSGAAPSFGSTPLRSAPQAPRQDFSNVRSGSSSTAPPPGAPVPVSAPPPAAQSYVVVAGDSLSKIARRFYGDANRWQKIFEANRDTVKDPDKIFPGQTLEIPD
jgi:nucleoid-associated protein YgaU